MSDNKYQRFSSRMFQVSPLFTSPGWYIRLREGKVIGPFANKETAQTALFNLFGITDTDNQIVTRIAGATYQYSDDRRK